MKQSASIPYRIEQGGLRVLLVTSRTRRRWILPKGKVAPRMLPGRSAEREAFEEAGVLGRLAKDPIGSYRQGDQIQDMLDDGVIVEAYALEVVDELPAWREMHFRERRWFSVKDALRVVRDPEIRSILQTFKRSMKR